MKKKIVVNGIEYVAKDGEESATPEETPVAPAEETPAETVAPEAEESLEKQIDAAAEKMVAKLGLDEIQKSLQELKTFVTPAKKESKISELMNLEKLMKKDVSQMTVREKIVGFFQAMIQNNNTVLKALSEGTDADGGYLFPNEFREEIIRDIEESPHMRQEVTVIPMRRDVMNIPTLVSGPVVTWTQENAAKTTTSAHFGQVTLTVKKMAAILYASDELIEDAGESINLVDFIVQLFSERMGTEEDRVITRGNGSTEPTGLATATVGSVAVSGNLDFDDIIELEYLLPNRYQQNAKFYSHRNNIKELRKIKDSNGRYLWQDAIAPGQPATFHGYPVVENNHLAESEIYFGDLKRAYWLGDRQRMTVKVSQDTETAFTHDQTAIRVVSRIAGNVVLAAAVKKLTGIP